MSGGLRQALWKHVEQTFVICSHTVRTRRSQASRKQRTIQVEAATLHELWYYPGKQEKIIIGVYICILLMLV
jgi:hypothetical protein